jgi:hypothetical protein
VEEGQKEEEEGRGGGTGRRIKLTDKCTSCAHHKSNQISSTSGIPPILL